MKPGSFLSKFSSTDTSPSRHDDEVREFIAEQLESRILYSAAPAPVAVPVEDVAREAAPQSEGDFESIDSFIAASREVADIPQTSAESEILMLVSFEENGIENPVVFESVSPAFRVWEMRTGEGFKTARVAEPVDFTIIPIDSTEIETDAAYEVEIDESSVADGVFVDFPSFAAHEKLTALRDSAHDAAFGLEGEPVLAAVLGFGHIERTFPNVRSFAA